MSDLWGPCTETYLNVLESRLRYLKDASSAHFHAMMTCFSNAVRENDIFARWELRRCGAHPMRTIKDTEIEVYLANIPFDIKERAAKGYIVCLHVVRFDDFQQIFPNLTHMQRLMCGTTIPSLWVNYNSERNTFSKDSVLRLLTAHFYAPAVVTYVALKEKSNFVSGLTLMLVGRAVQACRDAASVISFPPHWQDMDAFRYGMSDVIRERLRSTSPILICVQSDNACRRAVLYWMWAPVPVVKDVKRMIAQMVWETRIYLDMWVAKRPEKRLKA